LFIKVIILYDSDTDFIAGGLRIKFFRDGEQEFIIIFFFNESESINNEP